MDSITILQFLIPLIAAIIFTLLAIMPKGTEKTSNIFSQVLITFMSSLLASVSWFIFGLTWPAVATTAMFVSIGYLWYALGVIFAIFTLYVGIRSILTIFETKQPRLRLEQSVDGNGAE